MNTITAHDGCLSHRFSVEEEEGAVYLSTVTESDDEPGARSCVYIPAFVRAALAALIAGATVANDPRQLGMKL